MSFSLAWSRVLFLVLFLFTTHVHAIEDALFTSSVTYCNPPETLLIQRFQVAYFPGNQSVSFNLSAASVQSNVNVTANLFLNVYGMKPVNVTLDLCNILNGALCPLPAYNFTGADSIILPNSLEVADKIPTIAYKIPDLEGFAQLTLTEISTGTVRACVQATLANGWSAHRSEVEWGTGGAAIGMLIVSISLTLFASDAIAPFRFMELMYLFQTIASSALLSLNYPVVYRAFALNFAWALGLFPTSESSAIQDSINLLRHRTGGQLADSSSGSAVQFVNRRLSPYNKDAPSSSPGGGIGSLFRRASDVLASSSVASRLMKRDINGEVQIVTSDSDNVLDAGLPIYVNSLHVSTANAFMTVFLCSLMLFGLVLALLALGYGIRLLLKRRNALNHPILSNVKVDYFAFAWSWILRLVLISLGPLLIFIFYQWTLKDSWATILLSVLCFLTVGSLVGIPVFHIVRLVRQSGPSALYTLGVPSQPANAPMYAQYRPPRFYFLVPFLVASILRAITVAFAKHNSEAQVGLLIAIEVIMVTLHCWQRPYHSRGGDIFSTYLALVRLVCSGLLVAFLQDLEVKPIPRVVIGIVIAIIFSVAVIVTVINFIIDTGIQKLWSKRTDGESSSGSDSTSSGSMLEKGEMESKRDPALNSPKHEASDDEELIFANVRPHNPTPDQSTPIDNRFLSPFPISPTGSTVTSLEPPSIYSSRDSGTLTVGSLLSRNWSISYSQPYSPSGSSAHGYHGGKDWESLRGSVGGSSSLSHGRESSFSRRTSESFSTPSSPSARRGPASSSGSSGGGRVSRHPSTRLVQPYLPNHRDIPEDAAS